MLHSTERDEWLSYAESQGHTTKLEETPHEGPHADDPYLTEYVYDSDREILGHYMMNEDGTIEALICADAESYEHYCHYNGGYVQYYRKLDTVDSYFMSLFPGYTPICPGLMKESDLGKECIGIIDTTKKLHDRAVGIYGSEAMEVKELEQICHYLCSHLCNN